MKCLNHTSILTVACLAAFTFNTAAQQSPTGGGKPPRLTSDDVAVSRSQPGESVVVPSFDAKKWAKYSPGDQGLSLELPGGLKISEVPVPEDFRNDPSSQYSDVRLYAYPAGSLSVLVCYMQHKSVPSSVELRRTAVKFLDTLARPSGHSNARFTADPAGKFKILVPASYTINGRLVDTMGSVQSKDDKVWLVLSICQQGDEPARAMAQRITKSIALK